MSKQDAGASNSGRRRWLGPLRAGLLALFFMLPLVGLGLGDEASEIWESYRPGGIDDSAVVFAGDGTNDSIIVRKLTVPEDATAGAASFVFTGDASGSIQHNQQIIAGPLPAGLYESTEQVPIGWTLSSILCSRNATGNVGSATAFFSLDGDGSNATCFFTNVRNNLLFADSFEFGDTSGWSVTSPSPPGLCAHALCSTGEALQFGCNACVTDICDIDPVCCNNTWDFQCVREVTTVCGAPCP